MFFESDLTAHLILIFRHINSEFQMILQIIVLSLDQRTIFQFLSQNSQAFLN